MLKKLTLSAIAAVIVATGAIAEEDGAKVKNIPFSFDGPFGTFDQDQLQRGFQVYTEVCSACHGLKFVPLRSMAQLGYSEEQIRAYIDDVGMEVFDPELGDFRAATPSDKFPPNTGVGAPDLSLMAKARAGFHGPYGTGIKQLFLGTGGAEYIVALLNGYTGEEVEEAGAILYENTIFPGGKISMSPPLADEQVEFADGSPNDLASMSEDVAAFLMWTAEPEMMTRKKVGFMGLLFLGLLSVLLYLTNKRLWAPHKGKKSA